MRFQYLYVGLPGVNGLEYVEGDNWLGVALSALMRVPRELPLSKQVEQRVQALSTRQVRALFKKGIRASSLSELGLDG